MKKIYLLVLSFLVSSCYTLKPDSKAIAAKNHNDIQEVSQPILVKKRNAIGLSFQIITPLVAGAAMYQYVNPVVQYQDGFETRNYKPANAVIGVLGMLTLNKIFNYAFGQNKVKKLDNNDNIKWINKTGVANNNNFYFNSEFNNLTIIPKNKESNYEIKNINDVSRFKLLFPNASNGNIAQVLNKATTALENEDLVSLIELYPVNSENSKAKIKFIESAKTYNELFKRQNTFKETSINLELLASTLVLNAENAMDFYQRFPETKMQMKVVFNTLKSEISVLYYQDMINNYKENFTDLQEVDFEGKSNDQRTNYLKYILGYNNPDSILDLEVLIDHYVYLANASSQNLILDFYWNNLDKFYSDGNVMLYKMNQLGKSTNYSAWKIAKKNIESYIDSKLKLNINQYVTISNVNYTTNTSNVFERWKRANYTAGIVSNSDGVKYIIYGNIINNSKFDLPIQINASGELIKKSKMEGTGLGSNLLLSLGKLGAKIVGSSEDPTIRYQKIGTLENSFSYPNLINRKNYPWAIMLDYSPFVKQIGMNVMDFIKTSDDFIFQDILTSAAFLTNQAVSEEKLKEQSEWQNFAYNGLPNSQLMDEWRKESVDHNYWKVEEERIAEERRRWEAELRAKRDYAQATGKYFVIEKIYEATDTDNNVEYKYIVNVLKCLCFDKTIEVYHWPKTENYKAGYYESKTLNNDTYLGGDLKKVTENKIKSLCGCK